MIIAAKEKMDILKKNIKKTKINLVQKAIILGLFHISLLIIVGLIFGFGKSPYSSSTNTVLLNIFFIGSFLIGSEISRSYLIKKSTKNTKRNISTKLIVISLFYIFLYIPLNDFTKINLNNTEITLKFLGASIIPIFTINLLASFLSYIGGAKASISYLTTIFAFNWFSPIIPNPHWTILALVTTIAPMLGFFFIKDTLKPFIEKRKNRLKKTKNNHDLRYAAIAIFTVFLIFFTNGYFGIKPTVIYSKSMKPELEIGDIVVIKDLDNSKIDKGDIIQYERNDKSLIIHRVIDIKNEKNGRQFITKGDANNKADPITVSGSQIRGKAIFKIPIIGWFQIYFMSFFKIFSKKSTV
jgi:signal peptidase